jgi:nuclear GTP-binding protein
MEGDEEFEQFDAEGDELLAEDSSEDEDSMQVVSLPQSEYASRIH